MLCLNGRFGLSESLFGHEFVCDDSWKTNNVPPFITYLVSAPFVAATVSL